MNAIFEHANKATREARMFDTAGLLARRETFLQALKAEVLNGDAPAELAKGYASRIFKAMRAAEALALEEEEAYIATELWMQAGELEAEAARY